MAKGQLIAAMEFSNVAEDEFNDWYDLEHIPERQRVPGFLVCQRWIGAENPKQSVATYDLESVAVLEGPAYRAIGMDNLSVWSKRMMTRIKLLLRYEGDPLPTLQSLDGGRYVIYLGTFSKILSAGLRLGWAAAPAGSANGKARDHRPCDWVAAIGSSGRPGPPKVPTAVHDPAATQAVAYSPVPCTTLVVSGGSTAVA